MTDATLPKWETITREERFFTAMLFHEVRREPEPLWTLIKANKQKPFTVDERATVVDVGYEACFFRDMAFEDNARGRKALVERGKGSLKLTFDLLLVLSTGGFVIVEAKAQQPFGLNQLRDLEAAQALIAGDSVLPAAQRRSVLVGLCSSKATPRNSLRYFDAMVRWNELEGVFPSIKEHLHRADELYGN
jgi:hypothetical protein